MKVIRLDKVEKRPAPKDYPMFIGEVSTQPIVTPDMSQEMKIGNVNFSPGARTKLHTHPSDQVIVVVGGKGILAAREKENVVRAGDIVHIPKGEAHWHGATKTTSFSQISILLPGEATILE